MAASECKLKNSSADCPAGEQNHLASESASCIDWVPFNGRYGRYWFARSAQPHGAQDDESDLETPSTAPGHTLKPVDHDNKETRLVPVNGLKEIRLRAAVFRNFLGLTLSIGK